MNRKLLVAIASTAALAMAALVGAAGPARATYPGNTNGRLAFGITVDGNANPDVYSVLPNGRALRQLTDDPGFDGCAAYSADGESIAWCGPGGVWLMNQDGTNKRQLTTFGAWPDISPDGSEIVFSGAPPGSTNQDIWTVDVATGVLTRLTTADGLDQFGAWSPDGSKIVFESTRSGVKQVWLMNADGSNQTQLTVDATPKDQVPDWSPDGSQIAYVVRTAASGGDIWVINADGSDPRAITSGLDLLGTAWSPDGTQIASLNFTTRTVEAMNADGSDRHAVHPGGVQFVPGWQPRGTGLDDSGE
jgi:Tol biopolymer transport system component